MLNKKHRITRIDQKVTYKFATEAVKKRFLLELLQQKYYEE